MLIIFGVGGSTIFVWLPCWILHLFFLPNNNNNNIMYGIIFMCRLLFSWKPKASLVKTLPIFERHDPSFGPVIEHFRIPRARACTNTMFQCSIIRCCGSVIFMSTSVVSQTFDHPMLRFGYDHYVDFRRFPNLQTILLYIVKWTMFCVLTLKYIPFFFIFAELSNWCQENHVANK